jgi:RNA polymerase sigma-70 factor (ECF subfamily)
MAGSEPAQKSRLSSAGEAEERRLIEAAQRDPARFVALYESNFALLYAYVARRVRDRVAAEDFTSEVFHKALANLPRFKWTGAPFAAWLFRIASNLIAERSKRAAREGNQVASLSEPVPGFGLPLGQKQLEELERQAQVIQLVAELPRDQRRVLLMRFTEEKSIREIAGELGRSEGAIKQLQFRALGNLRLKLAKR